MTTATSAVQSRSRKVRAYVKAELKLRRVDDQLRTRLDTLAPLRERVRRASDLVWLKWQALNVAQKKEAVALVGDGRTTILRDGGA